MLETVSLFFLISVAIVRPLVAESYDSASSSISQALVGVGDPSPLRSLVFDLLILGGVAGWMMARLIDATRRYRKTGLEWGTVLVAVAALVSCVFAGNKRLAINASIDWICYPLLAVSLVQLMRQPWQRRLLLSAVLASACVQAFQCAEQYFVGFDETLAHYESIKTDLWARQGVDLDSAKVESFERRMLAHEATGTLPHSNVTGSYLVLCALAAMGAAVAMWRRAVTGSDRAIAAVAAALTLALIFAVLLTGSLGAMLAGGAALLLGAILLLFRSCIERHRRRALLLGWMLAGAGIVATIGHGLYHDSLPGWSLTFRWQYWKASSEMIADHPLTGVGRENFGRHYLHYKSIESPEEISNPHNLFVQAAADWGAMGLVGVFLMLWGAARVVCVPQKPRESIPSEDPQGERRLWPWMIPLALAVIFGRSVLLDSDNPSYLYYIAMTTGIVWIVGFAAFGLGRAGRFSSTATASTLPGTGVALGLFAFVLHDMINFAFFVPGSATTCFALLGYCIAESAEDEPDGRHQSGIARFLPITAVIVGMVAVTVLCVRPVVLADRHMQEARRTMGGYVLSPVDDLDATRQFQLAMDADPLDPTPCVRQARWLTGVSSVPQVHDEAIESALDALAEAVRRDPHKVRLRRMQMRLHRERARSSGNADEFLAAIESGRRALVLYPENPEGIEALGDCKLDAGESMKSSRWLREAIEDYERALALDDRRLAWEALHGFREKDKQRIAAKIARARRLLRGGD